MPRASTKPQRLSAYAVTACVALLTAGCNGPTGYTISGTGGSSSGAVGSSSSSSGGMTTPPVPTYTVGGTVTGLSSTATGLVIQDATNNTLAIVTNGRFTFPGALHAGDPYTVQVQTQPGTPAQWCRVSAGSGVISEADVTNVAVSCLTTGKYLFTVNPYDNAGNGSVAAFAIDPTTGALTAAMGSPYSPTESQPYYVAVDPSGKYIYVANSASGSISTDGVGAGGALTLDVVPPATTTGGAPYSIAIDNSFLYVGSNNNPSGSLIESFSLQNGALTAMGTSASDNTPYSLAIDSGSALLFAANTFTADLTVDSIGAGGALAAASAGSPVPFQYGAGTNSPYAVALYRGAKYLYVTDSTANTVSLYGYDATGALTQQAVYAVGTAPTGGVTAQNGLAVDPTGSYLYVADSMSGKVAGFSINANTGALSPVAGSPFIASGTASTFTPTWVQIDPSAQFAYVTNGDAGTISSFSINFATGALTAIGAPLSTVISGGGPGSLAIE